MRNEVTRHEDGSSSWKCEKCKKDVWRFRGTSSASCGNCGAQYSISGQRYRDDWRDNPSNYDDNIGDLEGYEMQHAGDE
jgi:predicted amidophosphoribosyltransferase